MIQFIFTISIIGIALAIPMFLYAHHLYNNYGFPSIDGEDLEMIGLVFFATIIAGASLLGLLVTWAAP